jgi:amidohydrolase
MPSAETIKEVRHYLHQNPEMSGREAQTADFLQKFILQNFPDFIITKSSNSHGFVAAKKYGEGVHIGFRAELDALPIAEENKFEHKSKKKGSSHACGHDGHMSILLATMQGLEAQSNVSGTASFLFQPAEETGKGAKILLEDDALNGYGPDVLVALHNIPGEPLGLVLSRSGTFACGSVGVRLNVKGKTAHAAHPEDAVNPLMLATTFLDEIIMVSNKTKGFSLATPIALQSGLDTFGVSPLESTLLVTLRAALSSDLERMMREATRMTDEIKEIEDATAEVTFEDFFPSTSNEYFHSNLEDICTTLKRPFRQMENPFRWSEDFGHYSDRCKTHMFGLGAGIQTAPLHASTYDFPDELISSGSEIFVEFYNHAQRV